MAVKNRHSTFVHLVNLGNPYFLYLRENPAVVLVSPPLTEGNFHKWKRDMIVALESKNEEHFHFDTFPYPPPTYPMHEAWRRCNRMVMSWLTRSMSPSIKQSMMWMDSAFEIWKDLKDHFLHSDKFHSADLQDQIQSCKQGDSNISEYYACLKILWKELELYQCFLLCTCSSIFSCGLIPKLKKKREGDYVIRFLHGLNDVYAPVRSKVMLMEPMPSLVKNFSLVL